MFLVYAQESFEAADFRSPKRNTIFLAGPTPRDEAVPSWRPPAISHFEGMGFEGALIIPEPRDGDWSACYDYQRKWEQIGLDLATVILFWVPRDPKTLPGFTTNIEWGRCTIKYPQKLVLGFPASAPKMGYFGEDARELAIPLEHDLRRTCALALKLIEQRTR